MIKMITINEYVQSRFEIGLLENNRERCFTGGFKDFPVYSADVVLTEIFHYQKMLRDSKYGLELVKPEDMEGKDQQTKSTNAFHENNRRLNSKLFGLIAGEANLSVGSDPISSIFSIDHRTVSIGMPDHSKLYVAVSDDQVDELVNPVLELNPTQIYRDSDPRDISKMSREDKYTPVREFLSKVYLNSLGETIEFEREGSKYNLRICFESSPSDNLMGNKPRFEFSVNDLSMPYEAVTDFMSGLTQERIMGYANPGGSFFEDEDRFYISNKDQIPRHQVN
jgi:hypothetical protein